MHFYKTGLRHGFVKFGTLYERILKFAGAVGVAFSVDCTNLAESKQQLNTALRRLVDSGFLKRVKFEGFYLYFLPWLSPKIKPYRPKAGAERQERYRACKAKQVSSVFLWRG